MNAIQRPYEVQPFELVRILHPPVFTHVTTSSSSNAGVFNATSPGAAAGTASPPGFGGPQASTSASIAAARAAGSPPAPISLSGRLSQLVNPRLGADNRRTSWANDSQVTHIAGAIPIASSSTSNAPTPTPVDVATQSTTAGQANDSASLLKQAIRTAEAGNDTLYIAGNEGSIAVWKLDASRNKGKEREVQSDTAAEIAIASTAADTAYLLDQYNVVPNRRPIEKLAILSTVGKAIVLSEGVLTFHNLPSFAPLTALPPIRGVSTFAADSSNPHSSSVNVCIIKRRSMQLYQVSQYSIEQIKDLPLRSTAILGVLRRSHLCIADSVNYAMVDFDDATMTPLLPISQDPPDSQPPDAPEARPPDAAKPKSYQRPSIIAVGADEFLVASHTGHSTLGLFVRENGEPTRGTLEWASNPKSIVVDDPFVFALLSNNTLEIHSLVTQELMQVLHLTTALLPKTVAAAPSLPPTPSGGVDTPGSIIGKPDVFQPKSLVICSAGFPARNFQPNTSNAFSPLLVPQTSSSINLVKIDVPIVARRVEDDGNNSNMSIPGRTDQEAPITPKRRQLTRQTSALTAARPRSVSRPSAYTQSIPTSTLVLGRDTVLGLSPLTLVAQADAYIVNNRIEDAVRMLRALGQLNTRDKIDEAQYVRQKAAWTYIKSTRFKEAAPLLFQGRVDPRLVIRLFTDICGDLMKAQEGRSATIHAGVASLIETVDSIGDIISANLVRTYTPHLEVTSPPVKGLQVKLEYAANNMLRDFLIPWRIERRSQGFAALGFDDGDTTLTNDIDKLEQLVDTCLAKLYLRDQEHIPALVNMLEREPHNCDVDELASLLEANCLHWHLSQLYLTAGRVQETLRVWKELVDGKRHDDRFTQGPTKIYNLLESSPDAVLMTEYGLWLVTKDRTLGLRLLKSIPPTSALDIARCIDTLYAHDDGVADEFLEHAVFQRKGTDGKFHSKLVERYTEHLSKALEEPNTRDALNNAKRAFIDAANTTELSFHVLLSEKEVLLQTRMTIAKFAILLHASYLYDAPHAMAQLGSLQSLQFLQAIVSAKLFLHEKVLQILATSLRDLVAAEAYCSLAGSGDILGAKAVRDLLSTKDLQLAFPSALLRKDGRRKQAPGYKAPSVADKEAQRQDLLNLLLKVTLEQSIAASEEQRTSEQARASHIIDAQAIRIPARKLLPSIPDGWELHLMESYLIRSQRRSLHAGYEQKLVKAMLQGKNTDATLCYYDLVQRLGGTLAEEAEGDNGSDAEDVVYLEKAGEVYDEKATDIP